MLNPRIGQHGATMIELMVALVIFGIMVALAIPSYRDWIQNQQTRAAAESILNGIQLTRNTAVNNNAAVRFVVCPPDTSWQVLAISATAPAPSGVGAATCWTVFSNEYVVQTRSSVEGSKNAVVTTIPAGTNNVTFNSFGRVTVNANSTPAITQLQVNNPLGSRPLQVNVGLSGNIRMCDPASSLALSDPRHC